jgi:hypothetical protein
MASVVPGRRKPMAHFAIAYSCACMAIRLATISCGFLNFVVAICWLIRRYARIVANVIVWS